MRTMRCIGLIGLLLCAAGCPDSRTLQNRGQLSVFQPAKRHDVDASVYVIDPPDEITIHAPSIKELDGLKQTVRPDGIIDLPLLGEVPVNGLTPRQLAAQLRENASRFYTNPEIRVDVAANSKFYDLFGPGVAVGGKKAFTGNDSVVKAMAEAGFTSGAWPEKVVLSRPSKDATIIIDFTRVFTRGDLAQNYKLEEGDVIYVPNSPLTQLNIDLTRIVGPFTGVSQAYGGAQALGVR